MNLLVCRCFVRPLLNPTMQQSKTLKALYRIFFPLVLANFKVTETKSQIHFVTKTTWVERHSIKSGKFHLLLL